MCACIPQEPREPVCRGGPYVCASHGRPCMPASHGEARLRASRGDPGGTRVRSCRRRSSPTSPCPRRCPGQAPSGDSWARRRAAGATRVSPVDKQRDAIPRGCRLGATFVHTRVENRGRVGACASIFRSGYLGSARQSQAPLAAARRVPSSPGAPGARRHRQQSSERVIKRL